MNKEERVSVKISKPVCTEHCERLGKKIIKSLLERGKIIRGVKWWKKKKFQIEDYN